MLSNRNKCVDDTGNKEEDILNFNVFLKSVAYLALKRSKHRLRRKSGNFLIIFLGFREFLDIFV